MKTDFEFWLEYHAKAFPGFAKWTGENAGQVEHMRRILGQYTRRQLEAATDALYGQDEQPRGYSNHARVIRRLVGDLSGAGVAGVKRGPEVRDDRLTSICARCGDYGIVTVLSPHTLAGLRHGGHPRGLVSCVVVCDCSAGQGKMGTRWSDHHCLVVYEQVLDAAIAREQDFHDLTDAMWQVARERVVIRDEELRPQVQELSGEALP